MKLGIQSRGNMLMLNLLFGIDDIVPNVGPTIEILVILWSLVLRTNRIF